MFSGTGVNGPGKANPPRATGGVRRAAKGDPLDFEVVIREGRGETRHHVTMSREMCKRLTAGKHTPERCVEGAFRFLLDREPKESSSNYETRTHLGLSKDSPLRRAVQRSGTIVATPILSGLHHRYARI